MQQKAEQYEAPPPSYNRKEHSTHGLSQKPSIAQIISYVIVVTSISIYFSSTIAIENYPVLMALYVFFGAILIISSAISTLKDPTDRIVYYYKWSRFDKQVIFSPDYDKVLFCEYCDSYCYANSKHCRTCNRCVNNFDHHCMWFNNCVGQRNYKYFLISIIATFFYAIIIVIHVVMISFSVEFNNQSNLIRIILSWVIGLIMVIFAFLIVNLIILHIYLIITNQTTYQFLQKKKRLQEQQEQQRKSKQKQEIKKRNDNSIKDINSEQSIANTKIVVISNEQSNNQYLDKQKNIFNNNSNKIKNQDDFFEQQLSKHSKKVDSLKQMNDKNEQNDHDITLNNYEEKNHSDDELKFPQFLIKNKSLKLLLSGSKASRPSNRKLEAHEEQQSQG